MKKEYVKPQNRVVMLKDHLLVDPITTSGFTGDEAKSYHFDEDSDGSDSSSDVWED